MTEPTKETLERWIAMVTEPHDGTDRTRIYWGDEPQRLAAYLCTRAAESDELAAARERAVQDIGHLLAINDEKYRAAQSERDELRKENERLKEAAREVVTRHRSTNFVECLPVEEAIDELASALTQQETPK